MEDTTLAVVVLLIGGFIFGTIAMTAAASLERSRGARAETMKTVGANAGLTYTADHIDLDFKNSTEPTQTTYGPFSRAEIVQFNVFGTRYRSSLRHVLQSDATGVEIFVFDFEWGIRNLHGPDMFFCQTIAAFRRPEYAFPHFEDRDKDWRAEGCGKWLLVWRHHTTIKPHELVVFLEGVRDIERQFSHARSP